MIVNEDDASYPGVGEIIPMRANHLDICKFDDVEDDGYQLVKGKIKQFTEPTELAKSIEVFELTISRLLYASTFF